MGERTVSRTRIGIIGVGGLATGIHLPVLSSFPEAQLCAVCDWKPERAEKARRRFPQSRCYVSYHEMLEKEELDAVFVLVQPDMLFRLAMDCISAGLHVFMEKPMGITLFQADSLRKLADSKKRHLWVGYNRRTIPLVVEMVNRMHCLTTVNHVEGTFYKNSSAAFYDGCAGAFVCDTVHVIDLVRHIAGGSPQKATMLETTDTDSGLARAWYGAVTFDNGVTGTINANYASGGRVHTFGIHGPGASAYIDLGFGDAGCSSRILRSGSGTHSLSAAGGGDMVTETFDGIAVANSSDYAHYYGYAEEVRQFLERVRSKPFAGDPGRTEADYQTMKLVQMLLDARI